MIFLGRILSWAMVVLGLFMTAAGLYIAFSFQGEARLAAAKRYLGSVTTGDAINQGMLMLTAGVIIGLITIIANNTKPN